MLNDQDRHELRGMLCHWLKLTPAAAAERTAQIEAKQGDAAERLLDLIRTRENQHRAAVERAIEQTLTPEP